MKTQTKVIIVIIILALIGAVIGFYFWNKKKQAAKKVLNPNEVANPANSNMLPGGALPLQTFVIPNLTLSDPNTILVESPVLVDNKELTTAQRRN